MRGFILALLLTGLVMTEASATTKKGIDTPDAPSSAAARRTQGTESVALTNQLKDFKPVEGASLDDRMEAATRLAQSSREKRFWVGYRFDVRRGVGVDVLVGNSNRSTLHADFIARASTRYQTPNVALFLLKETADGSISRAEVYNLERSHSFGGHAVYWLDRANSEESLTFLHRLVQSTPQEGVAKQLTQAIGLHDHQLTESILKQVFRESRSEQVQAAAALWLGVIPGTKPFLVDIVRDEQRSTAVRVEAAAALGNSEDEAVGSTLRELYNGVSNREVKEKILEVLSSVKKDDNAVQFLTHVAANEPDATLRMQALSRLGRAPGAEAAAPGPSKGDQSEMTTRRMAAQAGNNGEDVLSRLRAAYATSTDPMMKEQIIRTASDLRDKDSAVRFLIELAEADPDCQTRGQAIYELSSIASRRLLLAPVERGNSADPDLSLKRESINDLGGAPSDYAIPLLVKISKSHPSAEIRFQAARRLGKICDARTLDFFKQVLSK